MRLSGSALGAEVIQVSGILIPEKPLFVPGLIFPQVTRVRNVAFGAETEAGGESEPPGCPLRPGSCSSRWTGTVPQERLVPSARAELRQPCSLQLPHVQGASLTDTNRLLQPEHKSLQPPTAREGNAHAKLTSYLTQPCSGGYVC